MRKRIAAGFLAVALATSCFTGCGTKTPLPDDYYVPQVTESETESASVGQSLTQSQETKESIDDETIDEEIKRSINFFLDTSWSMKRSSEVIQLLAAATKCAAGYKERHYFTVNELQELIEVTEQQALSNTHGYGAPLDLIKEGSLPYDAAGVNILTTDLQSCTTCSELGRWLVEAGCTGYSFYVFNMTYEGDMKFSKYINSEDLEEYTVKDCSFNKKEFLMIVFGDNELVDRYDSFFQSKLTTFDDYDCCHVSLHDSEERDESFLKMKPTGYFEKDIANVEYDNTNMIYGLAPVDTEDLIFTCTNTFVMEKSAISSGQAKDAVKAIFYAVPEGPLPEVEQAVVTKVLAYNSKTESYEESDVKFIIDSDVSMDGLPAVTAEPGTKEYEYLVKRLGKDIVSDEPVFTLTISNEDLPEGIYAVEVQVTFEATGEVTNLQQFTALHSAGLEEYTAALSSECTAVEGSKTHYIYTGDNETSPFTKLLEFERLTDELIAAGAVTESDNEMITLRLVIDNS